MNNTNTSYDYDDLKIIVVRDQQWFRAKDILKKLDNDQNLESINNFINKNIAKEYKKSLLFKKENNSKIHREIYINKSEFINLIIRCKKWIKNKLIYKPVQNLILILF